MARGRFLSKSLSDDPDFNLALSSDFSRLLWVMLVMHLDAENRFAGEAYFVRSKVLPWRADIGGNQVEAALQEYEKLGFITRYYDEGGRRMLQALKLAGYQIHPQTGWSRARQLVLERDDYTCQYCERPAEHVDHIIPRCQGGGDGMDNLVAACASCNLSKGGRTPEQAGMTLLEAP